MVTTHVRTHPHPVTAGRLPALLWIAANLSAVVGDLAILGTVLIAGNIGGSTGTSSATLTEKMLLTGGLVLIAGSLLASRLLRRAVRMHTPGEMSVYAARSTETPDVIWQVIRLVVVIAALLMISRAWNSENFLAPIGLSTYGAASIMLGTVLLLQDWRRNGRVHRREVLLALLARIIPGFMHLAVSSSAPFWEAYAGDQAAVSFALLSGLLGVIAAGIYAGINGAKQLTRSELHEEAIDGLAEVLSKDELAPTLKRREDARSLARVLITVALVALPGLLLLGLFLDLPIVTAVAGIAIGFGIAGYLWVLS